MAQQKGPGSTELVSLGDEQQVLEVVTSATYKLWDAVNTLTRLRPTKRSRYRVTIFGSARVPNDHWVYRAVRDLASELARLDCVIITGGGPGLMQAANEGVHVAKPDASEGSVGIRVDLPFEQDVNAFVTEAFDHPRASRGLGAHDPFRLRAGPFPPRARRTAVSMRALRGAGTCGPPAALAASSTASAIPGFVRRSKRASVVHVDGTIAGTVDTSLGPEFFRSFRG